MEGRKKCEDGRQESVERKESLLNMRDESRGKKEDQSYGGKRKWNKNEREGGGRVKKVDRHTGNEWRKEQEVEEEETREGNG